MLHFCTFAIFFLRSKALSIPTDNSTLTGGNDASLDDIGDRVPLILDANATGSANGTDEGYTFPGKLTDPWRIRGNALDRYSINYPYIWVFQHYTLPTLSKSKAQGYIEKNIALLGARRSPARAYVPELDLPTLHGSGDYGWHLANHNGKGTTLDLWYVTLQKMKVYVAQYGRFGNVKSVVIKIYQWDESEENQVGSAVCRFGEGMHSSRQV